MFDAASWYPYTLKSCAVCFRCPACSTDVLPSHIALAAGPFQLSLPSCVQFLDPFVIKLPLPAPHFFLGTTVCLAPRCLAKAHEAWGRHVLFRTAFLQQCMELLRASPLSLFRKDEVELGCRQMRGHCCTISATRTCIDQHCLRLRNGNGFFVNSNYNRTFCVAS